MRVDRISWEVVDQIGLEHHCLVTNIEWKQLQSLSKYLVKLFGVLLRVQDRDSRSLLAPIEAIFREEKGSTNGGPSAYCCAPD